MQPHESSASGVSLMVHPPASAPVAGSVADKYGGVTTPRRVHLAALAALAVSVLLAAVTLNHGMWYKLGGSENGEVGLGIVSDCAWELTSRSCASVRAAFVSCTAAIALGGLSLASTLVASRQGTLEAAVLLGFVLFSHAAASVLTVTLAALGQGAKVYSSVAELGSLSVSFGLFTCGAILAVAVFATHLFLTLRAVRFVGPAGALPDRRAY